MLLFIGIFLVIYKTDLILLFRSILIVKTNMPTKKISNLGKSGTDSAKDYNRQGIKSYNAKKFYDAINNYDFAIMLDPDYYEAFTNRAAAKLAIGKFFEAIEDCDSAIALMHDNTTAYHHRGCAKLNINDIEGAISDFMTALEYNPTHANSYYYLGIAYYKRQDLARAKMNWESAMKFGSSKAHDMIAKYCR